MSDKTSEIITTIIPEPGYVYVKAYIPKNQTFKSLRPEIGEAQKSVIIAVGGEFTDESGLHKPNPNWKEGTVIIHADNANDFTQDHEPRRFVHWSRVMGVLHEK